MSNPPFGKQMATPEEIGPLYRFAAYECDRVLKPGGRAVFVVADDAALTDAVRRSKWTPERRLRVEILGQLATVSVWRKRDAPATLDADA